MKKRGMSCSEALQHVKSKRAVAFPNSGFLLQLQSFEESLRGLISDNQLVITYYIISLISLILF